MSSIARNPRPDAPKSAFFTRKAFFAAAVAMVSTIGALAAFGPQALSLRSLTASMFGAEPKGQVEVLSSQDTEHFAPQAMLTDSGTLGVARSGHTATLLADGRVLVVGGSGDLSAEVFDPATSASTPTTGNANTVRTGHTATLLANGSVMITGGAADSSTEFFDPSGGTFAVGPNMTTPRTGHTATLLANGNVLIAGGGSDTAEIWDGSVFTPVAGTMTASRTNASAALMSDSRVLIVGGDGSNSAEIFNASPGEGESNFTAAGGTLTVSRSRAHLRVLPDGKVQIIGGSDDGSMEVYDPAADIIGAYAHVVPATDPCANLINYVLKAQTRAALIFSGSPDASRDRNGFTITELGSNEALVIGGTSSAGTALNSVTVFQSSSATVTTDKLDYAPGQTVTVTGTGYDAGETVRVMIHEDPHTEFERGFDAIADASGNFTGTYLVQDYDLYMRFIVGARGLTSQRTAQTTFTDAPVTQFDIAPNHVTAIGSHTFTALVRNTSSTAGSDGARCIRIIPPAGITFTAATHVVANPGTGAGQTGNWTLTPPAVGSNFVQLRNGEGASGRSLFGTSLTSANWVRFEITATATATGTGTWTARMHQDGSVDCAGGGNTDLLGVRVGGTFTRDYTADFRDPLAVNPATAGVVTPTVTQGTTGQAFRVRITRTAGGDDLSYAAVALPTCLTNVTPTGAFSTIDSGSPNFQAHLSDNFIRLVSSSSTPSFSGTKMAANAEWVQVHFTANVPVSCTPGAQVFRTASWKNTDPQTAQDDIFKLQTGTNHPTLTVTPANVAPVAQALNVSTNEDTALPITLSATDADGNNTTFSIVTPPTPAQGSLGAIGAPSCTGTVPKTCTAVVTFTPTANYNGPASFTYKANDGTVDSANATVSITVDPVNDAPSFVKGADQTVNEDAGAQTVPGWATAISSGPANESAQTVSFGTTNDNNGLFSAQPSIAPNGTLTYTPAANAFGSAIVSVTATDSGSGTPPNVNQSAAQTFTITVNSVNDAPAGTDNSVVTNEDTAYTFSAANFGFTDPNDAPPNTLAAVKITTLATDGTLKLGGVDVVAGQIVPVASIGNLTFHPAADENGSPYATFTFQVQDNGGTALGGVDLDPTANTITVNVTAVNDVPTAVDNSYSTSEENLLTVDAPGVLGNDSDIDGPNPLTAIVVSPPAPAQGTLSLNSDGSFTFQPAAGFTGPATFTYKANDGANDSNVATVTINVTAAVCVDPRFAAGWTARQAIPSANASMGLEDVNGTLYAVGGSTGGCSGLNTLLAYDGSTNTWTPRADMPTPRWFAGTASLNGKLYVGGGAVGCGAGTTAFEVYDPSSNTWDTLAPIPAARYANRLAAANGKIYAIGGQTDGPPTSYADVWEYDPGADTWTAKAPLPQPRALHGVAVVNGLIYVTGGYDGPLQTTATATNYIYDPAADSWSTGAPMPQIRVYHGSASLNGKVYVTGGGGTEGSVVSYDPAANAWSTEPSLITPRYSLGTGASGGRIYVIGGFPPAGSSPIDDVESYAPDLGDMVAWYPGNNNPREVVNGNNGTLAGTAGYGTGKVNEAFTFDGSDDAVVTAPDSGHLDITNAITIDAWINANAVSQDQGAAIVAKGGFGDGGYAIDIINPGTLRFYFNDAANNVRQVYVVGWLTGKVGTWRHIAATYDQATGDLHLYDNGALIATSTGVDDPPVGTLIGLNDHELSIGSRQNQGLGGGSGTYNLTFNGSIDEVEIFSRALSAAEIKSLFDASYKGKCNTAPVANDQSVETDANTPLPITLTGTDAEGNPLTYTVVAGPDPLHGSLSGTAPNLTFTPTTGYYGPASFTFKANDGFGDSNTATITIDVKCTGPTVTDNPDNVTTTYGDGDVTFTAAADGVPMPTVQWQVNTGSGFVDLANGGGVSGATSTTLTISDPTVAMSGYQYQAVFKSSCSTATTTAATLAVNKANAVVVVTPYDVTYDGQPHTATVTSITGVNGETGTTVGTVDVSNTTHTDAGTYASDYWFFTGTANYNDIGNTTITDEIDKAGSTTTITCAAGSVYTGSAIEPCTYTVVGNEAAAPVLVAAGTAVPTAGYANNINAGVNTASASFTFGGDANHNGSDDTENFSIDKAGSTTTITCAAGSVYTGSAIEPCTYTVVGNEAAAPVLVAAGTAVPTAGYANNINAGVNTASASFTFGGDANHNGSDDTENFSIDKAGSTTTITCAAGSVYTGSAIEPCTYTVVGNEAAAPVLVAAGTAVPTAGYANNINAGVNTASASFTFGGDANHNGSDDTENFSIDKAGSTTTITCAAGSVYTGSAIEPCTYTVVGNEAAAPVLVAAGTAVPTAGYANNINAGVNTASASFTFGGDANHNGSDDTENFSIDKAGSTTTITCAAGSVYTGSAIEPCTYTVVGNEAAAPVLVAAGTAVPTAGYANNINAGVNTASASFTFGGDANHNGSDDTENFSIDKAGSTTTITCAAGSVYTGSAIEPCTYTVVGNEAAAPVLVAAGTAVPTAGYANNINAGVNTASASFTFGGDANHNGSDDTENFSIDKAGSTTTITCAAGSVYTGSAIEPCTYTVVGNEAAAPVLVAAGTAVPTAGYANNINAGVNTASASFTFGGDANHNGSDDTENFSIDKAGSTTTITCAAGSVYTGSAIEPCTYTVVGNEAAAPVLVAAGTAVPTAGYANNINAGVNTASASFTFDGDANHNGSDDTENFSIDKAGSTTTITCAAGSVYTGSAIEPCTYTVVGNEAAAPVLVAAGTAVPTAGYANNINAGVNTASASFTFGGDANHNGSDDTENFSIDKADASVTANNKSRNYGDTNPALDATVVGEVGDPINYTLATTATQFSNVGPYPITVTLGSNPNYNVVPNNGTLTVNPRPIRVAAVSTGKVYGEVDPPLTYVVSGVGGGLVDDDTQASVFNGNVVRAPGATVGNYAITQGTLSVVSANYTLINFNPGVFTITPATLTITAANQTKAFGLTFTFDETTPSDDFTVTGLLFSDTVTSVTLTSTGAAAGAAVGSHPIVPSAAVGTGLTNYTINYVNGTLTIGAVTFVVIDEDSIDNGPEPMHFTANDVNDNNAGLGVRTPLPYWTSHIGGVVTLYGGKVGDEGFFALPDAAALPATWATVPRPDKLRNFVGVNSYTPPVLNGLGTGPNPEAYLDKIDGVRPMRSTLLRQLPGSTICAVVYDSDISMNYSPLQGSLKGSNLGIVAIHVTEVTDHVGTPHLPYVRGTVLDPTAACSQTLTNPQASFVNYTQNGWDGTSPAVLNTTSFGNVYPGGSVTIGSGTHTVTFTTVTAIKSFLPAGGKAKALNTTSPLGNNPTKTVGGALAGNVLALKFNVDFSAYGAPPFRTGFGDLKIAPGNPMAGATVNQLLAYSNNALSTGVLSHSLPGVTPATFQSLDKLDAFLAKINQNYVDGVEDLNLLRP